MDIKFVKNRFFIFPILLCIVILLSFGSSLNSDFKIDENIFRGGGHFSQPYHSLRDFFSRGDSKHYYPLYYLLNTMLHRLFPENALAMHCVNLGLFYVNSLLLFVIARRLTKNFIMAVLTSILFSIHPINADHLSHIDIINTLFLGVLLETSLLLFWHFIDNPQKRIFLGLSCLSYFMALFCAESALLFPLYLFWLIFIALKYPLRPSLRLSAPFFLLSGLYFLLWVCLMNPFQAFLQGCHNLSLTFAQYTATIFLLIVWHISNLFYPNNIVLIFNILPINDHIVFINFCLILFLAIWLQYFLSIYRQREKAFSFLWFFSGFLFILPAAFAYPHMGLVIEPHWFFFPAMGFFLWFSIMLFELKQTHRLIFLIILASYSGLLMLRTQEQNFKSKNDLVYSYYWLKNAPHNLPARLILSSYYEQGIYTDIDPLLLPELIETVDVFIDTQTYDRAIALILRLIECPDLSDSSKGQLRIKLAALYYKIGRKAAAESTINSLVRTQLGGGIYFSMAKVFETMALNKEAIEILQKYMRMNSSDKEVYLYVGVLYANENDLKNAIDNWQKGSSLDPSDGRFSKYLLEAEKLQERR